VVIGISHAQVSAAPGVAHAVVHHGLVPSDFPAGAGKGGHLLFLGRMSPDKGADRAVRVARAAGVPLLLAAKMREPSEREYFARQVEPLLGDGARFLGEADRATKTSLLADAKGLLVPIRWPEPFGMVMIESLACGTPVLAFPEGAAPEVVEHRRTGFLCRDEADMATAVGRLDELSRQDCREAVERRFSARRMAADHVRVYRSAIARRRLARPGHETHALRQPLDLHPPGRVDLDVDRRRAERHAPQPQ
jgi:glycosyltransferase involved in cell wall biosynthesis